MYSWMASWFDSSEQTDTTLTAPATKPADPDDWTWIEVIKESNDQEIIVQTSETSRNQQATVPPELTKKKRRRKVDLSSCRFSKALHNDTPLFQHPKPSHKTLKRIRTAPLDIRALCRRERTTSEILSASVANATFCFELPFDRMDYYDVLEKAVLVRFIMELIMRAECRSRKDSRLKCKFRANGQLKLGWKREPLALPWKKQLAIEWKHEERLAIEWKEDGYPKAIEYPERRALKSPVERLPITAPATRLPLEGPSIPLALEGRRTLAITGERRLSIEGPPVVIQSTDDLENDVESVIFRPTNAFINVKEYIVPVSTRRFLPSWMNNIDVAEEPFPAWMLAIDVDCFKDEIHPVPSWMKRIDVDYFKDEIHPVPSWIKRIDVFDSSSEKQTPKGTGESQQWWDSVYREIPEWMEQDDSAFPSWMQLIDICETNSNCVESNDMDADLRRIQIFDTFNSALHNVDDHLRRIHVFGDQKTALHSLPHWLQQVDAFHQTNECLHVLPHWMQDMSLPSETESFTDVCDDELECWLDAIDLFDTSSSEDELECWLDAINLFDISTSDETPHQSDSMEEFENWLNSLETSILGATTADREVPDWMQRIDSELFTRSLSTQLPAWMSRIDVFDEDDDMELLVSHSKTQVDEFINYSLAHDMATWMGFSDDNLDTNPYAVESEILRKYIGQCDGESESRDEWFSPSWYKPTGDGGFANSAQKICDGVMSVAMLLAAYNTTESSHQPPPSPVEQDAKSCDIVCRKKRTPAAGANKPTSPQLVRKNKKWLKRRNNMAVVSARKCKRAPKTFSGRGGTRAC